MTKRHTVCLLLAIAIATSLTSCSRDPNVRKVKYFESGQRYLDKGKYREAFIQFSNAVQVDPTYADAHYRLAQACLRLERWTPAYDELVRTVELQPGNYGARLDLANLLIAARELKQAREQIDVLLREQATNPMVHAAAANLFAGQDNLTAAVQQMQQAIDLTPDRADFYIALASLENQLNQPEVAERNFSKAVELNPDAVEAHLALASYYQSIGQLVEAEQQLGNAIKAQPKNPDLRAALVQLYTFEGKKDSAEDVARQTRDRFPDNSAGYRMLGDLYYATGNYASALGEYTALYRKHPSDLQVKKNYVQLLIIENRLDEAEKLNAEILKSDHNDVDALVDLGQIQIRRGKPKDAVGTLQSAAKVDSRNAPAYYQLGVAFEQLGNSAQADSSWQNAVRLRPDLSEAHLALAKSALRDGDMPALEQSATQIIRLLPASPAGYAMRALSYLKRGKFDRAEQDAEKAISLAPQSPDGYMQMGNLRLAQKDYIQAEKFYQKTLERDPGSADALGSLMQIYVSRKEVQKAVAVAQAQIAKVPNSSAFYDVLGTTRFDQKKTEIDIEAAEADLRKATELNKNNADAWLKLSQVLAARGRVSEAIATSQRALLDNPNQLAFYVLLGRLYEREGNWENAKQSYQQALQIDPRNPQASINLARVIAQSGGNLDLALSSAQTARRGLPDSSTAADTLGWVFYQKGAYKSAIDSFQEALKLTDKSKFPENPTLHYHLGLAATRGMGRMLLPVNTSSEYSRLIPTPQRRAMSESCWDSCTDNICYYCLACDRVAKRAHQLKDYWRHKLFSLLRKNLEDPDSEFPNFPGLLSSASSQGRRPCFLWPSSA